MKALASMHSGLWMKMCGSMIFIVTMRNAGPSNLIPGASPVLPELASPVPLPSLVPATPPVVGTPPLLMPPLVVPAPQPPESCSQVSSRKPPRKQPNRAAAAKLTSTEPRTMAVSIHDLARATDPLRAR